MLRYLGVLAEGEEASSGESQDVGVVIEESLADLDEIVNFNSASIPDWAIQPMIEFVASRVAPLFGLPRGDENVARASVAAAKARKFGTGTTLEIEYY